MENIYNFLKLSDRLFSSGMPTPEQISQIAKSGAQVVINLATSDSEGFLPNEKELAEAQSMTYYAIPVDWENPTTDDLNKFSAIMDRHHHEKILIHCQANYRATGFIMIYRVNRLGWAEENAFKDLRKIWNPAEYPVWESFIKKSLKAQS
jgi:protein tyrosine phosphatase (PTP) superfamily phosphohydrolase (DUF442 family)